MPIARWAARAAVCAALAAGGCRSAPAPPAGESAPLRIVVMDPLAGPLACACVAGHAQRDYAALARSLEGRLARPVELAFSEDLLSVHRLERGKTDLVIGKRSVVVADAAAAGLPLRPLAALTGKDGSTDLHGLFVVRASDPAGKLADLAGRRIVFGPADEDERHAAAVAALRAVGVEPGEELPTAPDCNTAALAVVEDQADAAVISGYALPLLTGCNVIDAGALRVVARTAPVPFVTVFATERVAPGEEAAILQALLAARLDPELLKAMESAGGFVAAGAGPGADRRGEWTDWRGPRRDAVSDFVPSRLPEKPTFLWKRPLTGQAMSGLAVAGRSVLVADKTADRTRDVWRCLDADTGREVWSLAYPARGEMDYTNSPRANPVVAGGLAYLLGAFGDLHCVRLDSGQVVWKTNILTQFGGALPTWGTCSTPLVVEEMLIVNPGAAEASLVALDRRTGKVLWKAPGDPPAYASFIVGAFGGLRQIVGYDAASLGGWDVQTGRRLWTLVPPNEGDFNVPTPIDAGGRLLVVTENNGARLYGFDTGGRIRPAPLAVNPDLAPDTITPVVIDGMVFGCDGKLYCLDLRDGLKTLWAAEDAAFADYASLIAGRGRVLITAGDGTLLLVRAEVKGFALVSRLGVFTDPSTEVWSHPALAPGRLYVRSQNEVRCLLLEE